MVVFQMRIYFHFVSNIDIVTMTRITSYNVCYTKLLRYSEVLDLYALKYGIQISRRITSYNVCYTKLLRWSHDIGGFENTAPAHVFKRWLAFGLLSSHSRLHGSSSYRVPWAYDEEAVNVTRHFTQLKCRLMPYLYDTAMQATEQGLPSMRAMLLEFPDDPAAEMLDRQYMLGDSLLVAPVFSEEGEASYYLPEGKWTRNNFV